MNRVKFFKLIRVERQRRMEVPNGIPSMPPFDFHFSILQRIDNLLEENKNLIQTIRTNQQSDDPNIVEQSADMIRKLNYNLMQVQAPLSHFEGSPNLSTIFTDGSSSKAVMYDTCCNEINVIETVLSLEVIVQ